MSGSGMFREVKQISGLVRRVRELNQRGYRAYAPALGGVLWQTATISKARKMPVRERVRRICPRPLRQK